MNYEETLSRLKEEKKELEDKINNSDRDTKELNKRKLNLVEKLIKGYSQSSTEEVSSDKVDQAFSKVYGFTKEKEEVKSLLLTQKYFKSKGLKTGIKGKSLCFVGPPGVGKTYFAEQFTEALGRKFHRINLGGAASAIIITGGEEMWVGAKQGEIVNAITKTQTCNPVVLLDEIEKAGKDSHRGTIENALLHVLDPEQNEHFKDHFLDLEIDISQITFIATANELEKIPDPLKNRLEIIKLKEYDEGEKLQIGKILIDKIFQKDYENSNRDLFEMEEEALRALIRKSKEPGVRQLEKKIRKTINWCVSQWVQALERGEEEQKIVIDEDKVNELFSQNPEKENEEEEKNEETELREKIEELKKDNEDLKKEKANLGLVKPLEISEEKEFCEKHEKKILWTSNKTCSLCELDEQAKQFMNLINQENWEKIEQIWQERKIEWMKQSEQLRSGDEEEQELAQQIKENIKKIDKKIKQSKLTKNNNSTSPQPESGNKNWMLIGGVGTIILLVGCSLTWFLIKRAKKKKKNKNFGKAMTS